MPADTFSYRTNGLFYDIFNERTGLVEVELVDCIAEVRNHIAELNAKAREDEAAEQAAVAEQQADYLAQQREMDLIYRQVARLYDADKPANDPRNFAVREILGAIDSLGRPDAEQKEAA